MFDYILNAPVNIMIYYYLPQHISSTCIYPVFRHTLHVYPSKVTSFGLLRGHHQTYTFKNVWKKLYNHPYNL